MKEIREKSKEELNKILHELHDKLRECRFKVAQKQLKNVREIRNLKRTIARILTFLNQEKITKSKE